MIGDDSRGRVWARGTVHKNAMIGDDARGRARARGRHGAQERHYWGRLARARGGVTMHKNIKNVEITKSRICQTKKCFCATEAGMEFA